MYSTCHFVYEDANKAQKQVCDGWNKEHVCCQSWLGSGPMVSDLFNVYPTDARVNNLRSNYPYGVVGSNKGISGDPDHHALGKLGTSAVSGYSGTCYEPDDRYKGDFARTFFYMVARYRDKILNSGDGAKMFSSNPTNLTAYSLAFLLEWHRNDPVSEKEIDRNQAVYGEQNNRNPFIDYPDLVEYIWGTKKNQQVDLSTMTPTCDGGGQDPAGEVKYGVSWSVNGVILSVDSIVENKKIQALPETPESCSSNSNVFVGWTDAPIDGIAGEAPAILYREPADFPPITADVTYYAVFAHAETIDHGKVESTESVNMKAQGYTNGQEVTTITKGDVTLTFGKGTAGSNVPKYYNTGEAVRCYPGNSMTVTAESITKIVLTFGSGDSNNAISVSTGALSGSTWTGDADQVVFSVGGSSGHRRIAQVDVTMNGSGAQTVYSDYLTTCSTTTAIGQTEVAPAATKILRNGQIYILVGEQMYNLTGQKIK
jgi:endonuclease I